MGYLAIFKSNYRIVKNKWVDLQTFRLPTKQIHIFSIDSRHGKIVWYVCRGLPTFKGPADQIIMPVWAVLHIGLFNYRLRNIVFRKLS